MIIQHTETNQLKVDHISTLFHATVFKNSDSEDFTSYTKFSALSQKILPIMIEEYDSIFEEQLTRISPIQMKDIQFKFK